MATLAAQDGTLYDVPDENAQAAQEAGWTPATPEQIQSADAEKKYGDQPLKAGALAAAREFTFGISDPLLARTGLVSKETIQGLESAPSNQTANYVGQGAGFLGGLIGTGPLKLTAKAGGLAARAVVHAGEDTLFKALARGAIEGAVSTGLYSLSRSVSEQAMDGNAPLNGEKILAHTLNGMETGAVYGAGLTALARPFQGLFRRAPVGGGAEDLAATEAAALPETTAPSEPSPGSTAPPDYGKRPFGAGAISGFAKAYRSIAESIDQMASKTVSQFAPEINEGFRATHGNLSTPEEWALRALDIKKGQVERIYEKGLYEKAAHELLEDPRFGTSIKDKMGVEQMVQEKLDTAGAHLENGYKFFAEHATPADAFDGNRLADWVDNLANEKSELTTLNSPIVSRLRAEAEQIRNSLGPSEAGDPLSKAVQYRQNLDDFIYSNKGVDSERPAVQVFRQVRNELQGQIKDTAKGIADRAGAPEQYRQFAKALDTYHVNKELQAIVMDRGLFADTANNKFGLTSFIAGAGAGGSIAGWPGAVAGVMGREWLRRKGPFVFARALYQANKNAAARAASAGFRAEVTQALEEEAASGATATIPEAEQPTLQNAITKGAPLPTPESGLPPPPPVGPPPVSFMAPTPQSKFGKFRDVIQKAATMGNAQLFATHATLWEMDPDYRDTMQKAGLVGEDSPLEEARASDRARGMDDLQRHLGTIDQSHRQQIEAFATKGHAPSIKDRPPTVAETLKELDDLAQLSASPQAMAERVGLGDRIHAVAPQTAAQAGMAAVQAIQFLHSVAPRKPEPGILPTQEPDWKPSAVEVERYQRYARAVKRPQTVLEDVRRGRITPEAAHAFRTVYPNLADSIAQGYLETIGANKVKLTYQHLLSLSTLLGMPINPSMTPEAITANQDAFMRAKTKQPPKGMPGSKLNTGPELLTSSQRIESGGQQ